jgi:hypothetical protein
MVNKYIPKNGTPFKQVVDLTSTTSTNGGATVATIVCYDVEWIDAVINCADNDVTITINPDTALGNVATTSTALTKGTTGNHIWVVVNGTPQPVSTNYGSHTAVITAISTVGGAHGTITGYVVLHGIRRV